MKAFRVFLGSLPFSLRGRMVDSPLPFAVPTPGCFSCASLGVVAQLCFRMVTNVPALRTRARTGVSSAPDGHPHLLGHTRGEQSSAPSLGVPPGSGWGLL